jgi:PAS domain S-box-containing protein
MSNADSGARARRGLSLCDPVGNTFRSVDSAFAEIHGYAVDELIGKPVEDVIAPERRGRLDEIKQSALVEGHLSFETVHLRKDGSRFPALVSIVVASDGDGAVLVGAAAVEDLSERDAAPVQVRDGHLQYDASRAREKYRLTTREIEVLRLVAAGKTDKDIAKTLGRSPYTVHNHVRHILLKMGASSRTDATVRALREGLV